MRIELYLFDKTKQECLGYDFSKYIELGFTENRTLDGTIDTYGVNLLLPFEDKIEPSTKFIARIYDDTGEYQERHMVLQDDVVEKPIMSDDEFYIHRLSLADPSIIAQQRAVDNIAITYKLEDVNISTVTMDTESPISELRVNSWGAHIPTYNFGSYDKSAITTIYTFGNYFEWVYPTLTPNSSVVSYSTTSTLTALKTNYVYGTGLNQHTSIYFDIPLLRMYYGVPFTDTYAVAGLVPVKFKVYARNRRTRVITYLYGSANDYAVATPSQYLDNDISWVQNSGINYMDDDFGYLIQQRVRGLNKTSIQKYARSSYPNDNWDSTTNLPTNRRIVIDFINDVDNYDYFVEIKREKVPNSYYDVDPNAEQSEQFDIFHQFATKEIHFSQQKSTLGSASYETQVEEVYSDDSEAITFNFSVFNAANYTQAITRPSEVYSAYYLLQKAQYASQTYFKDSGVNYLDKELSFSVNEVNKNLLQSIKLRENFYQNKNLWEIFTEIGNYVHGKPIIRFNVEEQKDNYLLDFIKYGDTEYKESKSTRDNVFNSRYFSEYISELTSYTRNLVQLGLDITEYLKPHTSSEDYLVYNDSAILKTKYPILEIDKLLIDNYTSQVDITNYVYEYNVYKLLPFTNTYPSKQRAIYYHLGSNVIEGMQYIAPQVNPGTLLYPMKVIIQEAFGGGADLTISNYRFIITYKAKLDQRIEQFRPDLRKYVLNSEFDVYPIHTQYNNQEERYIDSEQLGKNLYGNLIRTGNAVYEITEWCNDTSELKDRGDLYSIDNKNYYVSKVKNVYYIDHIESVVELTQDFNRLAQIIGIPSEPRFYEISEQSNITRDISINDLYVISTDSARLENEGLDIVSTTNNNAGMADEFMNLLFGYENSYKYVLTYFKGDGDKTFDTDSNSFNIGVINPIATFIHGTTLTFTWEMEDNFNAGDSYKESGSAYPSGYFAFYRAIFENITQDAYKSLNPTRYTDVYGRADLVDFVFSKEVPYSTDVIGQDKDIIDKDINELMPNASDIYNYTYNGWFRGLNVLRDYVAYFGTALNKLPPYESSFAIQGVSRPTYYQPLDDDIENGLAPFMSNDRGIYIVKDNREKIKFSYNFQLLSDSDRFVISKNIFEREKNNVRAIAIWDKEINKLDDYIDPSNTTTMTIYQGPGTGTAVLYFDYPTIPDGYTIDDLKAIALVYGLEQYGRYKLIIGRNVSGLEPADMGDSWVLCKPNSKYYKTNTTQIQDLVDSGKLPTQE